MLENRRKSGFTRKNLDPNMHLKHDRPSPITIFRRYRKALLLLPLLTSLTRPVLAENLKTVKLVDALVAEGILLPDIKDDVREYLEHHHINGRSDVLVALYFGERVRILGRDRVRSTDLYSIQEGTLYPKEQEKANHELARYLRLLVKNELVQSDIGKEFESKIAQSSFVSKLGLLEEIHSYVEYADWLTPERLRKYAEKLRTQNIISPTNYERLLNDIAKGSIKSEFQLIAYCKYAKGFRLSEYSDNPKDYVEKIHREVSTLLPELSFSDFYFQIVEEKYYETQNYKSYQLVVTLKNDGKFYKHKSFISPEDSGPNKGYFGKISAQDFYQIFNHILAEKNSRLRLHDIKSTLRIPSLRSDYSKFGIIALTKIQEEALHDSERFIDVSYEQFTPALKRKKIETGIRRWQEIGLLIGLTDSQIKAGISEALLNRQESMNDLIRYFPDMVYQYPLKASTSEEEYENILKEIGRLSRGQFVPSKISVETDSAQTITKIEFSIGQKRHQFKLHYSPRWLELDFFIYINDIVKASKIRGRFYQLYPVDEGGCLIYLYPEQHRILKKEKLLYFDLPL